MRFLSLRYLPVFLIGFLVLTSCSVEGDISDIQPLTGNIFEQGAPDDLLEITFATSEFISNEVRFDWTSNFSYFSEEELENIRISVSINDQEKGRLTVDRTFAIIRNINAEFGDILTISLRLSSLNGQRSDILSQRDIIFN